MNASNFLTPFLANLLTQLPMLIVCAVGIAFTLVWWNRAPRASLLALLGFILGLVISLLLPLVQQVIWSGLAEVEADTRARWSTALAFVWAVLRAGTYLLLLMAVYAERSARATPAAARF